jgi:hypothetical protein
VTNLALAGPLTSRSREGLAALHPAPSTVRRGRGRGSRPRPLLLEHRVGNGGSRPPAVTDRPELGQPPRCLPREQGRWCRPPVVVGRPEPGQPSHQTSAARARARERETGCPADAQPAKPPRCSPHRRAARSLPPRTDPARGRSDPALGGLDPARRPAIPPEKLGVGKAVEESGSGDP